MTHLSLFSGIGGLDLAAERAGFQTVGQCEWADYPTKVLEKHWPTVPRWRDIRTMTGENFYERTGLRTVDVISGGFPCQPFSVAGKRRGKEDDRYLWPEMLRVIQELRPAWVVGENVAGIVSLALDKVLSDLEDKGYETRAFVFPACGVNAPHRRERVAIVAHTGSAGRRGPRHLCDLRGMQSRENRQREADKPNKSGEIPTTLAYADFYGLEEQGTEGRGQRQQQERRKKSASDDWWRAEPDVGRVAYGVSSRVDRLKCLGNAVVPQQFYPIFKAIADIEAGIGGNDGTTD